jgi:RNA polymerase primary sigma factor
MFDPQRPVCPSSPSPLTTYLGEINGTPLLSAEEEKTLARRIRQGDAEARDHLTRANLRLVVKIAQGFVGRGLDLDDLVAEGNLGLLRAVGRFDPDVGTRFATYAGYCIAQAMQKTVVGAGSAVRLPASAVRLVWTWRRAAARLQEELGRSPSEDEVAGVLHLSSKRLKVVRAALRAGHGSIQGSEEDAGQELDRWLPDSHTEEPGEALEEADERGRMRGMLDQLGAREAAVLRLRFGLDGKKPLTLAAVGSRLGLTRERVRQLERRALNRLRRGLEADGGPVPSRLQRGKRAVAVG